MPKMRGFWALLLVPPRTDSNHSQPKMRELLDPIASGADVVLVALCHFWDVADRRTANGVVPIRAQAYDGGERGGVPMIDPMFSAGKYDLPIQFNTKATKGDLKKDIAALLTSYIKDLEANGASAEVVSGVTNFRRSCSYVLSNYLRGIHSNAFDDFTKGLAYLGIENSSLLSARLGKEVLFGDALTRSLPTTARTRCFTFPSTDAVL